VAQETLTVAGIDVSFEHHGDMAGETILLVHCGGGHSGWWSELLPSLPQNLQIVTMDLSGHGDSGRRVKYSPEDWAAEVAAVARQTSSGAPVTIVGHSLGGLVGIYTAARFPEVVSNLILVDPPVLHVKARDTPLRTKIYNSPEDALARFRLRPPETKASQQVLLAIARQGLKQVDNGWAWKYDPAASQCFTVEGVAAQLAQIACPTSCIYGEFSPYVDETTACYIGDIAQRAVAATSIPGAYHHIPLDAPVELAVAIEGALQPAKG